MTYLNLNYSKTLIEMDSENDMSTSDDFGIIDLVCHVNKKTLGRVSNTVDPLPYSRI